MKWYQRQVSLYQSHADRTGEAVAIGEILRSRFAANISEIVALRSLNNSTEKNQQVKRELKSGLMCFSPSALLSNRKDVVSMTGIMQIDFDAADVQGYDIDELKAAVFALPFVCFVSLSCSGNGFYALALIAEPDRQKEYALHIFDVLQDYGITCDRSKGRNYNDLRYVSYDQNMLLKEEAEPLRVKRFKAEKAVEARKQRNYTKNTYSTNHAPLIASQRNKILSAQVGQRWLTVQQAAYTLGGAVPKGLNEQDGLTALISAIYENTAFNNEHDKYIKCARKCFADGQLKPLL